MVVHAWEKDGNISNPKYICGAANLLTRARLFKFKMLYLLYKKAAQYVENKINLVPFLLSLKEIKNKNAKYPVASNFIHM